MTNGHKIVCKYMRIFGLELLFEHCIALRAYVYDISLVLMVGGVYEYNKMRGCWWSDVNW